MMKLCSENCQWPTVNSSTALDMLNWRLIEYFIEYDITILLADSYNTFHMCKYLNVYSELD